MADPILQVEESRNVMYSLIATKRQAMNEQDVENIMNSETFSVDRLETAQISDNLNAEQANRLRDYEARVAQDERDLEELRQRNNTPEGEKDYYCKMILAEQNKMKLRLLKASVLGRDTAARRIQAESLERIISYRQNVLRYYNGIPDPRWLQRRRRDEQTAALEKEQAVYREISAELNLRILTTAALDKVNAERRAPGGDAAVLRDFMDADFSEQALEVDYVIENLDACLHNIELIRRVQGMSPDRNPDMSDEIYAPYRLKLRAVEEYANVVESVLWEHGLTIDYDSLQIKEIREDDEAFARRRRAYLANGALRFCMGVREYSQIGEDSELLPETDQTDSRKTRVETKLGALEAELGIEDLRRVNMCIMRSTTRTVGKLGPARPGEVIRAAGEDSQGKMEHLQVKMRILKIYHKLKARITAGMEGGIEAFQSLERFVENYVLANRGIYENRREWEEKEARAFSALKNALTRVHQFAQNQSGRYAAVLLGLLAEESGGYLEVPPDEIHIVEDSRIGLREREQPFRSKMRTYKDCTDMPLFSHRPNIKDVEQGGLGDCYLLAGLISVVDQNAEEIMNIMKDNGDGTVTVCFKKQNARGADYTPCYVTVRKTIPVSEIGGSDSFSRGALWVKMMEKAYAASGLHILDKINEDRRKLGIDPPLDPVSLRDLIVRGEQKVDYDDIAGGSSGSFTGLLLGKKENQHLLEQNRTDHAVDRVCKLLEPAQEPNWENNSAFGNDSVDSLVYEVLGKESSVRAEAFRTMEKPAENTPAGDPVMRQYKDFTSSKEVCMIHVDIINTMAEKLKIDFLGLESEEKIRNWYDALKPVFRSYVNNRALHVVDARYRDKEAVIDDTIKKYGRLGDSALSTEKFNAVVDVLKERHVRLFRETRQRGQGAGGGAAVQTRDRYYTTADLKLYEEINTALRTGAYVSFGTIEFSGKRTGRGGESEKGAMVGNHAYSIINTRKRKIGGVERIFFLVMNPWAEKGAVYDVKSDGVSERAVYGEKDGEREEGVFLFELRRFAEIVEHWDAVPA